jgi:hypothetical protein
MKGTLTHVKNPEELFQRRRFLTTAGGAGLAAAAALMIPGTKAQASSGPLLDNPSGDTATQVLTAALIAEDLAVTFYYNALKGACIQDPALAGPGGTALHPAPGGDAGNVMYLRAALAEEFTHANLLRSKLGGKSATGDPVKTFFLPTGCFDTVASMTAVLEALESAFIAAYLQATIEFAQMASDSIAWGVKQVNPVGGFMHSRELQWYAQLASSIGGIECEHRVLGRDIAGLMPANNLNYEGNDGILSVNNGGSSAVSALTPFITGGSGYTSYDLHIASAGVQTFKVPTSGAYPPQPKRRSDGL